jgi:hypothetical protein
LTNLISLELEHIGDLVITNSKPFAFLRKLKQLSIKYSTLLFQGNDFRTNKIEFGSEEIEDLTLYNNTYRFDQSSRYKSDIENIPSIFKSYLK